LNCKYKEEAVCRHNCSCIDGYLPKDNVVKKCDIYSIFQQEQLVINQLKENGFPRSTFNSSLNDYVGNDIQENISFIKKYLNTFSINSKSLYFYGTNGTQKSTIARCMGKEIISKGLKSKYLLADELVKNLTRSEREEEQRDYIEKLILTDFLIIDEFEKSKMVFYESKWQLKFIFPFLKKRIEIIQKPVLIISNSELKNISDDFDYSTYDLLKREIKDIRFFEDIYDYESSKTEFRNLLK
jgi:DNA replication protein DnaC